MSIVPPRLLLARLDNLNPTDYWTTDDGSGEYWLGYPYRWEVTFVVSPQAHGSHLTQTPQQYNGLDVKVGDWFADFITGTSVMIVEITNQDDTYVTAIVQDMDRFNVFTDSTGQGTGINPGDGAIFTLGDDGLPILAPMSVNYGVLSQNLAWQLDQVSRFRYRNYLRSHYPVHQPGHEFSVGELLVLGVDGYERAEADDYVDSIVGSVSAIGIPGPEWFNFRPVGRVVENLSPPLPGNPGDLIYISATGTLTLNKPTAWARPVYIRLETGSKGIVLDRGVDAVSKNGYSSQTYVVSNVIERDALDGLNLGDQCLIKDAGNGEWNHYIYEANDTWTLMGTQDSSNVDSATKTIEITHQSDPSSIIATISTGRRIEEVVINVKEAFDGDASVTVGVDANHSFLMTAAQSDLSAENAYQSVPACVLKNGGLDTKVKYWLATSGSTKGKASITVTYS